VDHILQTTPVSVRRRQAGRLVIVLTLAAVLLAFLVAPVIQAVGTIPAAHLANTVPAAGLAKYVYTSAAAALHGAEQMIVSFALACSVGIFLLGTADLLWRFSRRPDSRT
jgi:hypothetical protein